MAEVQEPVVSEEEDLGPLDPGELIRIVLDYRQEAEDARKTRDALTDRNIAAYFSKREAPSLEGQSNEFLPKVALGVDMTAAIINRGMTGYGQWFSVDVPPPNLPDRLDGEDIEKLMHKHLEPQQSAMGDMESFPTTMTDATKMGLLQSMLAVKIWGEYVPKRQLRITPVPVYDGDTIAGMREQLTMVETPEWRHRVSLVRQKDLYLDPSGANLYLVEASERDWHEVLADAQGPNAMYDLEVVLQMQRDARDTERDVDRAREQNIPPPVSTPRKKVQLLECWGDIIDYEGNLRYRNIVCTIANERYLIRPPELNPYWHQRFPYVVCPLIRVPGSPWHKAIYDDVVDLQLTLNMLFNQSVDGAAAASWNTRQVRMDVIENSGDFTEGIPPNATIILKAGTPPGTNAIENVQTGQVTQDALAVYALTDKELQAASMANDIRLGQVPQGRTTATAIATASEQGSLFFESIIFNLEQNFVQPALWMSWLNILQHAEDWVQPHLANLIGPVKAQVLERMSPAQRYLAYADEAKFKVYGVSSILARQKEFQKLLAVFQVLGPNADGPLAQAFWGSVNRDRLLDRLFQTLNMDPGQFMMTDEEKAQQQAQQQQASMQQLSALFGESTQGSAGAPGQRQPPAPRNPELAEQFREMQQMRQNGAGA